MEKVGNMLLISHDGDTYTLRMTEALQEDVGDVAFVDFYDEDQIEVDDAILNVEASKTVLEIVSPLAGTVIDRNLAAEANPQLLNSNKAEENWLVKLTNVDTEAFEALKEA